MGWQQQARSALECHHHDHAVWPRLREHERAMMRSQREPLASTPPDSTPPLFGHSSSADFVCPSPYLFEAAGVAVHLTPLATTVQSMRNSRGVGALRLGAGVSSSVELECVRTSSSAIWTCLQHYVVDSRRFSPRGSPVGHRHDIGITLTPGWQSDTRCSREER